MVYPKVYGQREACGEMQKPVDETLSNTLHMHHPVLVQLKKYMAHQGTVGETLTPGMGGRPEGKML